ncbi:MAG: hypothetical protein HQL67_10180 [Magnetococcales bacterium]|nr:hypothetical protein [Magnetococcales bacterium]
MSLFPSFFQYFNILTKKKLMISSSSSPRPKARFIGLFLTLSLLLILTPHGADSASVRKYRKPAYISNAYFSDKMSETKDQIQPLSIVKALEAQTDGVIGYFVLDLILTQSGSHNFKVNILNQAGDKVTDLTFPQVEAPKESVFPLYTAAGSVSGDIHPGLWFFKVYDRVDSDVWHSLGTFSIMVVSPEEKN